jgi:tetratricopeptide (TPR) repeat protein
MHLIIRLIATLGLLLSLDVQAEGGSTALDQGIRSLQTEWALAKYRTSEAQQDAAFEGLTRKAETLSAAYPQRAEPLIWQAIIESTHAGVVGGLGALSKVKHARGLLEQAEKLDAAALQGSVYTSLGSLYYQVPGWPLGFGDDAKAEVYLKKALALNPDGIDPNYFYGDFLRDQDRYQEAEVYLQKALDAPPRPDRAVADAGRRDEAHHALSEVRMHLAAN